MKAHGALNFFHRALTAIFKWWSLVIWLAASRFWVRCMSAHSEQRFLTIRVERVNGRLNPVYDAYSGPVATDFLFKSRPNSQITSRYRIPLVRNLIKLLPSSFRASLLYDYFDCDCTHNFFTISLLYSRTVRNIFVCPVSTTLFFTFNNRCQPKNILSNT